MTKSFSLTRFLRDLLWMFRLVVRTATLSTIIWALLVLFSSILGVAELWAIRGVVNSIVGFRGAGRIDLTLIGWLIGLGAVFAFQQVTSILEPYLRERIRVAAGFIIQDGALKKMGRLSIEMFDAESTHNAIRRVAERGDAQALELINNVLGVLRLVPIVAISAVILGTLNLWMPIMVIAGETVLLWHGMRMGRRARQFEVERTRQRRLADYYASLLTGRAYAAEVRLWGIASEILRRWHENLRDYFHNKTRVAVRNSAQGIGSVAGFAVVLAGAPAAVALLGGRVEPGLAALTLTAIRNVAAGMYMMLRSASAITQQAGYTTDARRILVEWDPEESEPSSVEAKENTHRTGHKSVAHFPNPIRYGIRLENVRYRYPNANRDALVGVTAEIKVGEIVALVGPNGAGKTTLGSILVGLRRPTSGTVFVDDVDMACIPPSEIRRACAAVFQQPVRFPATLSENITLGSLTKEGDPTREILEKVDLNVVAPETLLGPEFGGIDLSGGEWQRVAIARALARHDAQFLVFDEPTAALDPLAELALFERFAMLSSGRTTVLISHRLGPARLADRVLVLNEGQIVEEGSPVQLLSGGGLFAAMFSAQAEWYR